MVTQPGVRSLTIKDLPQLEANFPTPILTSFKDQISRQNLSGYGFYGLFVGKDLAAILHIRRHGPHDQWLAEKVTLPELGNLFVLEAYRGKGYSSQLIRHCESILRREGYTAVGLVVRADNLKAKELYEKSGYRLISELPSKLDRPLIKRLHYQKNYSG